MKTTLGNQEAEIFSRFRSLARGTKSNSCRLKNRQEVNHCIALTNVSIPKKWVLYPPHKFFPKKKKNRLALLTKSANHNACKYCIRAHPFDPVWFFLTLKFVLFFIIYYLIT